MTRRILYSPGFGAGWTTWNSGDVATFMLTCPYIVEFLDQGGKFTHEDCHNDPPHHLLKRLQNECLEKSHEDYVCILGADTLQVATVHGRVKIDEYDGSESYIEEGNFEGWK